MPNSFFFVLLMSHVFLVLVCDIMICVLSYLRIILLQEREREKEERGEKGDVYPFHIDAASIS